MNKKKTPTKVIIGLTGGIASGKKTAAHVFKKLGAYTINADEVYRDLTGKASALNLKIAKVFGASVLNKDFSLNRKILASIVFNDKTKLKLLNKITHPAIIKEIKIRIKKSKSNFIVLAAPLLIEARQTKLVDYVWLIACTKENQIKRLIRRDKISRKEALRKIKSQMSLREKIKFADVVINNNKTIKNLERQIKNAL